MDSLGVEQNYRIKNRQYGSVIEYYRIKNRQHVRQRWVQREDKGKEIRFGIAQNRTEYSKDSIPESAGFNKKI